MLKLDRDAAWRYILEVYARPGVAEDLLRRQQEDGLDIILHLFSLYAKDCLGRSIGGQERLEAVRLIKPWREQIIVPLRHLRRTLKEMPAPEGSGDAKESLRQAVKQAELDSEQIEFQALCDWFERRASAA